MRPSAKNSAGFTLLELMITITVLGILLGIGVPAFQDTIRNNRTAAQANELITAIATARSEASRRGMPVSLCAANADQSACAGANTDSWANGWVVFTDLTGTAGTIDAGDTILHTWPAINNRLTLTSGNVGFVRFGSNGAPIPVTAGIAFDLQHSGCTGQNHRRLQLNSTGRVNLVKQACT
jgi:type IV fimbrial biogenesis protein FimT